MIEKKLGNLKLKVYSGIDELPVERYHKFNLYCLLSAGIGSDVDSINKHISSIYQSLQKKDFKRLQTQFENYYATLNYILEGIDVQSTAFACLVYSINGKVQHDISDENLTKIVKKIGRGVKRQIIINSLNEVKKKLKRKSKPISKLQAIQEKQKYITGSLKDVLSSY